MVALVTLSRRLPRNNRIPSAVRRRMRAAWRRTYQPASKVASVLLAIEYGRKAMGTGTTSRWSRRVATGMAST